MSIPLKLPSDFLREMEELLGMDEAGRLAVAITFTAPPVSVRLNPLKPASSLPAPVRADVPWCAWGRYLMERPKFTYHPLFHAGCYYVQEASSMFVEQVYRTIEADATPRRVLDLCAAPGGKSTLWRTLLPARALLVANEPVRQRAQVLAENLTKWGQPDVVTTCALPAAFAPLGGWFDVVAADVPCSGEGMFRKDAGAVEEWSAGAVEACAARQWDIIRSVWPALREGGYLVYSTCTYNRSEDEDMVARICAELGAEPVAVKGVDAAWGVAGDMTGRGLPVCRFFPHRTEGEGLFLALLRKTAASPSAGERKKGKIRSARRTAPVKGAAELSRWICGDADFRLVQADEAHVVAVRETLAEEVQRVCAAVPALTAGVALAEMRGHKWVPSHALALSVLRAEDAFPVVELSEEDALRYLRREALVLPGGTPRGYVAVTYEGHALGFVNNVGARANNLYPQEWRIRT